MGSELAQSEAVDRLTRRSRGLAIGIVLCVLGLFAAGGFASAKMWDGHGSRHLALNMAIEAANGGDTPDLRNSGVAAILSFAAPATRALITLRLDPVVGAAASRYVRHLRELLPEAGSLGASIQSALDPRLAAADRLESLQQVNRSARQALDALRVAHDDPELAIAAKDYLFKLENAIARALAEHR